MYKGLAGQDILSLREQFGFNEIKQKQTPVLLLFISHFWGFTAWMLEATVVISFILHRNFDGWVILSLLVVNAFIGFYNELKSAKTVSALQHQLEIIVRVFRDNEWKLMPSRELLPGDIVRIRTGDFLSADMIVVEGRVKIDKSALTGETALIECNVGDRVYSGSVTKVGECVAQVSAIGIKTFFGKTASLVLTAKHKMQMEIVVTKIVKVLFASVIGVLGITTVLGLIHGLSFINLLPLLLILLVSAVPVGLPSMFTISMARGSKELAENGLLVTRLSATEDAATLTTLCLDKTGTITKNEISLRDILPFNDFSKEDILLYGALASIKENNDAIDLAFFDEVEKRKIDLSGYSRSSFIPFSSATKHTRADITSFNGERFIVAKGAYPAIKQLCNLTVNPLDTVIEQWAQNGFKTIAVATNKNNQWLMAGVAALYDSPREDSKDIIAQLKDAGLSIKMLTGDALPIGKEVAREVGVGDAIVTVADVRENDGGFSSETIHRYDGFADVLPEDKFNMVKAFQKEKQIVGMTGDGVNDAPALKQAEVGIAVKSATDVAKQSASIILLKDGLQQILSLIKVGRTIHTRIANYTVNKIAKTIQTILFVCVSFILTKEFVVEPVDMVMLLFLLDFVVLALSVDIASYAQKPASWDIRPLVKKGLLLGLLLFSECLIWFFCAKYIFHIEQPGQLHSLGFASLFFSSLLTIPVIRTELKFYRQPISTTLLWALILDSLLVITLLLIGFNSFEPLKSAVIAATILYFMFCSLVINDNLKNIFQKKAKPTL